MKISIRFILFAVLVNIGTALFAQISPDSSSLCKDPLSGKRIGVFGDSYVRNHREPFEKTWHYKFAKKHNMEYFNY